MRRVKVYSIDDGEEDQEKFKKFIVIKKPPDELQPKVKYKNILKEEDDFILDENNF